MMLNCLYPWGKWQWEIIGITPQLLTGKLILSFDAFENGFSFIPWNRSDEVEDGKASGKAMFIDLSNWIFCVFFVTHLRSRSLEVLFKIGGKFQRILS